MLGILICMSVLPVALTLAGCGTTTVSNPSSAAVYALRISLYDRYGPASGQVAVHVALYDDQGRSVEFTGGQTIGCNQVFLAWQPALFNVTGGYNGTVARQSVGGRYTIVYAHGGTLDTVEVMAQDGPAVTQPSNGADVAIPPVGSSLTIHYTPATDSTSVDGVAHDSQSHFVSGGDQSDTGSYVLPAPADTAPPAATPTVSETPTPPPFAQFVPGAGELDLYRYWHSTPPNPAFRSVTIDYTAGTAVFIHWR
jgi:hypothetical protein